MQAHARLVEKPFAPAIERLSDLTVCLASDEVMSMDHGAIENLVEQEGREVLRLLVQGHLDLRALAQPAEPVIGADGVERTHQRASRRGLMTRFGPVEVGRTAYGGRDVAQLHPVDAGLNLPRDRYSHGLRKHVASAAARGSYDDVVRTVREQTGGVVPKRQVEELAAKAAVDFDAFYAGRREEARVGEEAGAILVQTFDGKGVPMLKRHLREATRKKAGERTPRMKHRRSKGEKKATKRMATVAAVYTIEPFERTAEDIMLDLRPVHPVSVKRPRPEGKRVWADVEKTPEEVVRESFAEALHRDPDRKKRWVVLVDGNEHQINVVEKVAEGMGIEVTLILDMIHVAEYLWKAAWVFHEEGSDDAEPWVRQRLYDVLCGRAVHVAAGIRRSATMRGLLSKQREPADTCANYLLKYQDMMRYDQYLADGLPIATGVIEGACRYLVKDRMEITGARWSLEGAQAVLRLRSLWASGDFEEYWRFHTQREYERNHASRYRRVPNLRQSSRRERDQRCHLRLV